jgi:hypothetical protein
MLKLTSSDDTKLTPSQLLKIFLKRQNTVCRDSILWKWKFTYCRHWPERIWIFRPVAGTFRPLAWMSLAWMSLAWMSGTLLVLSHQNALTKNYR